MLRIALILTLIVTCFICQAQDSLQGKKVFETALNELEMMLNEKQANSYKRAVFLTENAYEGDIFSYEKYCHSIADLTNLCRAVIKSRELIYNAEDKEEVMKWAAIFTVITDTLPIIMNGTTVYHYPYTYDFEDIWGQKNWNQMFVTKLINTKKGNCHSLPSLYKILAEELGTKASLAIAPNHIYIKHQSKRDGWFNTELTSGIFPVDAWLMASGYIHLDAIVNKLYMEALNDKQSLSICVVDLAKGYERKYGTGDGKFILKACDIALKFYPNYINALLLKAETKRRQFLSIVKENETGNTSMVVNDANAKNIFNEMQELYVSIHKLGYRQMPEEMYLNWLVSLKEEKAKYENKKITNFKPN